MISVQELKRWLSTLPEDSNVGIDEGGLTLLCDADSEAYYEVGGMPDNQQTGPGFLEWLRNGGL